MKKFLMILMAATCFALTVNAGIVWRGTHKVCSDGITLTLYSSGRMVFWYNYNTYDGKYSVEDGYIKLFEDGKQIFALPYRYVNNTLQWVDIGGVKLYQCK